jgi:hypothetical protein
MTKGARALTVVSVLLGFLFVGAGQAAAAPERVAIPSIGVKAPVVYVGVKKNGELNIGWNPRAFYAMRRGDPPCDMSGSTLYVGHAWRSGNGVADRLLQLKRGDIARVGGCRFKMVRKRVIDDGASIRRLSRVDGPPLIHVMGCKANDYSKGTVVTFRRLGNTKPF